MAPANWVYPKLWQGGREMVLAGPLEQFKVLVLCAAEFQPSSRRLPSGLTVLRCPLLDDDDPITAPERRLIVATAKQVAQAVARGKRCLVTCRAGLNRSGIVTATALHMLTGYAGRTCVEIVQQHRPGALFNEVFVRELGRLRTAHGARLSA